MRHPTFRFALAPTAEQATTLARHCGASRYAFNQSLRLVTDALAASRTDLSATVPWSGFDLINAFNRWKASERAGRVFVVAPDGTPIKQVTGLSWRTEVSPKCSRRPPLILVERSLDTPRPRARSASRDTGAREGTPRAFVFGTRRIRAAVTEFASERHIPGRSPLPVQCALVSACWLVPLRGVPLLSRGWGWVLASSALPPQDGLVEPRTPTAAREPARRGSPTNGAGAATPPRWTSRSATGPPVQSRRFIAALALRSTSRPHRGHTQIRWSNRRSAR
jgi:hypothetical protein